MDFLFVTRCFQPDNLSTIKQNLKKVFAGTQDHYQHHIICDLTHGCKSASFAPFQDAVTNLTYVFQKGNDKYCSDILDITVKTYQDSYWVYVLDDDNILKDNFLQLKKYCEEADIIVFDAERRDEFPWLCKPRNLSPANCIGQVDFSNMLIRNSVAKKIGFYAPEDSFACDGLFMKKALEQKVKILNTEQVFAYYNKLEKVHENSFSDSL